MTWSEQIESSSPCKGNLIRWYWTGNEVDVHRVHLPIGTWKST